MKLLYMTIQRGSELFGNFATSRIVAILSLFDFVRIILAQNNLQKALSFVLFVCTYHVIQISRRKVVDATLKVRISCRKH